MTDIFAIANQKGGVGKTTTAVNLSASLASLGKHVLLVDLDPQGNASSGLGIPKHSIEKSIYNVLVGQIALDEAILETKVPNLSICPANRHLAGAELELVSAIARELRLKRALDSSTQSYECIIIDCPPSLSMLTINALVAAHSLIIPVQCEYYALEGISELMNTFELVRTSLNGRLRIGNILLTMFDPRNNLAHQIAKEVRNHFGDKVFRTAISRSVKLSESPSHGLPISLYDQQSKGAIQYLELAREFLERSGQRQSSASVVPLQRAQSVTA